jgi:hypothetical protein
MSRVFQLDLLSIVLIGDNGVGKSTILNLFPEDIILEIDDDLNEIYKKKIHIDGIQIILREIDASDLDQKFSSYGKLLQSIDVICFVSNSTEENVNLSKKLLLKIKQTFSNADTYYIANFQDVMSVLRKKRVEKIILTKTFEFSAIQDNSKENFIDILEEILKISKLKEKSYKIDKEIWKEINQAIQLEENGNLMSSANLFSKIAAKINDAKEPQIKGLYFLCKGWENLILAEGLSKPEKYLIATENFSKASTYFLDKKLAVLASANSIFSELLKLSSGSTDEFSLPNSRKKIENIANLFRKGGFEKELNWTLTILNHIKLK